MSARAGAAFPAGGFVDGAAGWDGDDGRHLSWGLGLSFARGRLVNPYVGVGQHRLRCPAERCGARREFVSSGFDLGTRIFLLGRRPWAPWIRAGAVRYDLEVEDEGAADERADASWGVEAGAGVEIRIAGDVFLSPAVRWIRVDHDLPSGEVRMRAWVADLGFVVGF